MAEPISSPNPTGPRRILHALAVSIPHVNGYCVRSRWIVETQRHDQGLEPLVVTSPFYPGNPASVEEATLAGTRYYRVPHPVDVDGGLNWGERLVAALYRLRHSSALRWLVSALRPGDPASAAFTTGGSPPAAGSGTRRPSRRSLDGLGRVLRRPARAIYHLLERFEERVLMRRFARELQRIAHRERVELIHAHSPFRIALPALWVARRLGLPLLYEVRGLWEESAVASGYSRRGDAAYRHWRSRETTVMRRADAVVCICEALRQEIVSRGVPEERVTVVPNAVPEELPATGSQEEDPDRGAAMALRRRLALCTLGYIGSLRELEGVDELVRGAAEIVAGGRDISLLVVGEGPVLEDLRRLARNLGLEGRAFFPGRVPHREVGAYYRLIDIFAITRPDVSVARKVTPLKPLEAMALGRPVVVSDLPALREIVGPEGNALLYEPGNPRDLARQCIRLLEDPGLRRRQVETARRWVLAERTWPRVLARLPGLYRRLRNPVGAL